MTANGFGVGAFELGADRAGIVLGAGASGVRTPPPLSLVAFDQLLHPVAGDVTSCAFDKADLPGVTRCQLCRETSANYVVKPDTAPAPAAPATKVTALTAVCQRVPITRTCHDLYYSRESLRGLCQRLRLRVQ